MKELVEKAKAGWENRFGEEFDTDQKKENCLYWPYEPYFFRVVYSENLERWYLSPKGQARYDEPDCFLCAKHDEFNKLELAMQFEHIGVFYNLKSVARYHFLMAPNEHREDPAPEDITTLQRLAQLSGWSIIGNLNNSGASYPSHVHYQSLDLKFPIVRFSKQVIVNTHSVTISKIDYLVAAYCFTANDKQGLYNIARIIPQLPQPFNLMFWDNHIYLIPRTKSVPSNTNGFKFATAEVCGTIFVRSEEQFEMFDLVTTIDALKNVGLDFHGQPAKDFEQQIIKISNAEVSI